VAYSQAAVSGWRVAASILYKLPQTAAGPDKDVSLSKATINLWSTYTYTVS